MIFFLINLFQLCLERLLCLVAQLSNDKPPVLTTYTNITPENRQARVTSTRGMLGSTEARSVWNAPSK